MNAPVESRVVVVNYDDPLRVASFQSDDEQTVEVSLTSGKGFFGLVDDVSEDGIVTLLCKQTKKWVRFHVSAVVCIAWDSGY